MEKVRDLMTKKVVVTTPDTLLVDAVEVLLSKQLTGLPVVDVDNRLIGIVTEYDLIVIGSSIHIPTFIKLFKELDLYKKDKGLIKDDLKKIFSMSVNEVMNREPLTLKEDAPIGLVIDTFSQHHKVNPIPIVDNDNRVTGIISRSDMLRILGAPNLRFHTNGTSRDVDNNINKFIDNFGRRFILISKRRTNWWLLTNLLFAVIGYAIAWFFILRLV